MANLASSMVSWFALFFATADAALPGDKSCLLQRAPPSAITSDLSGDIGESQGTFSIWRYSGVDAIPASQRNKVPVDWQIYTRYSGHPAFTKGLLLVDNSGGKKRQALEITAQDCQWRAQKGDQEWTLVKDGESLSVPDGNDYVTGFIMTKKDGRLKGQSNVRLNMQMKDFAQDAALLSLACRPKQHINFQMAMQQRHGSDLMQGALAPRMSFIEASASFVEPSFVASSIDSDDAVEVKSHWEELGGSAQDEKEKEELRRAQEEEENEWRAQNYQATEIQSMFRGQHGRREASAERKKVEAAAQLRAQQNSVQAMRKLLEDREQRRLAHYAVKLEGPTARSERSVLQWDSTKFNESRGYVDDTTMAGDTTTGMQWLKDACNGALATSQRVRAGQDGRRTQTEAATRQGGVATADGGGKEETTRHEQDHLAAHPLRGADA